MRQCENTHTTQINPTLSAELKSDDFPSG